MEDLFDSLSGRPYVGTRIIVPCPQCGNVSLLRCPKTGNYVCRRRFGGCGVSYRHFDKRIESILPPDHKPMTADGVNLVVPMSVWARSSVDGEFYEADYLGMTQDGQVRVKRKNHHTNVVDLEYVFYSKP